jgi:vesicle-associated membrane protein 7
MIYTMVCRGDRVLCDYDKGSGNYPAILFQLTQADLAEPNVSSPYPNSNYVFHRMRDEQVVFACMADNQVSNAAAFAYLAELRDRFHQRFRPEQVQAAIAYEFQNQFIDSIKALNSTLKSKSDFDKLTQINEKLNQAKDVVIATFDKLLVRVDELDLIVKRAQTLEDLSTQSRRDAATARQEAYWRNQKCKILGLGAAASGILLLLFFLL